MTTPTPLSASIRRAILVAEARGFVLPDSKSNLDDTPQVIMEPGVERVALNFLDGLGLWGGYGNTYYGYSRGGFEFTFTHLPAFSMGTQLDNADDGQIPVFNEDDGKYYPGDLLTAGKQAGLAQAVIEDFLSIVIETPVEKTYKVVNNLPFPINITSTSWEVAEGTIVDVDVPFGLIGAGSDITIEVDTPSMDAADLIVMINFTRDLNYESP